MPDSPHIPLVFDTLAPDEMTTRAEAFYADMERRRSTRFFTDQPVPKRLIELAIQTASSSGVGFCRSGE